MGAYGSWLFAASTVFSLFGLVYVAIPVVVLVVGAWLVSRRSGRPFWAIVSAATAAVVGLFVMAWISGERREVLTDEQLAVAANAAACLGAAFGVAAFAGFRAAARAIAGRRTTRSRSRLAP